jgi:tRNA (mo5U34)-methyltransferase
MASGASGRSRGQANQEQSSQRRDRLREQISALEPWFHNLHLPDGTQTAPNHYLGDFPAFKWEQLAPHVPENLSDWTVLDIGCNAGFYGFELARRGARVTGIDVDPRYLAQARWAAEQYGYGDRVQFRQLQVYELIHSAQMFDLVLFMGLFYHLRYPLLGLDIVAQKVRRMMVFQSLTMPGEEVVGTAEDYTLHDRDALRDPGWPHLAFIEHRFAGDPTNWWVPNRAAVEALLRSSGLRVTKRLEDREIYLCEPDTDRPSSVTTWNAAELLAATGRTPSDDGAASSVSISAND